MLIRPHATAAVLSWLGFVPRSLVTRFPAALWMTSFVVSPKFYSNGRKPMFSQCSDICHVLSVQNQPRTIIICRYFQFPHFFLAIL